MDGNYRGIVIGVFSGDGMVEFLLTGVMELFFVDGYVVHTGIKVLSAAQCL